MGRKRKSKARRAPKRRQKKLATKFNCLICNLADTVAVRMDRRNDIGVASCESCRATFSTSINGLSDPVDVYSEWVDERERIDEGTSKRKRARAT